MSRTVVIHMTGGQQREQMLEADVVEALPGALRLVRNPPDAHDETLASQVTLIPWHMIRRVRYPEYPA